MKIGFLGINAPVGKVKYQDERLMKLVEKFAPNKISPFFVEFNDNDFIGSDAIAVAKEKVWDLFIQDMEKIESRMNNTADEKEKAVLQKCLHALEKEMPLCDCQFTDEERLILRVLAPLTFKPVLIEANDVDTNILIEKALKKANVMFFYTAGKKEVHAWLVENGATAVACAGKIHSDLARGFIKAEIVSFNDFINVHNMQEAKANGLVKLVDKDYPVQDGDIIEIRFNV